MSRRQRVSVVAWTHVTLELRCGLGLCATREGTDGVNSKQQYRQQPYVIGLNEIWMLPKRVWKLLQRLARLRPDFAQWSEGNLSNQS